jgi:exopolysaccharide biosynthesis polyprenyl glycosylphosphotransferase
VDLAVVLLVCVAVMSDVGITVPLAVVTLSVFACMRLYRRRLSLRVLDDLPVILGAVVLGHLTSVTVHLLRGGALSYPRSLAIAGSLAAALIVGRSVAYRVANRVRCGGRVQALALIIGGGHVGIQLGRNLREHAEYGVTPVGYIDSNPRVAEGEHLPAPLLGGYHDLSAVIEDFNVAYVMVAFGAAREADLVDILRTCDRLNVEVFIVPRLFELHNSNRDTDDVWGIPLIRVRRAPFRSKGWRLKRALDVVASASALLLLLPVLAVCALGVRLEGGAGVIFKQSRVGLDGRPFQVLKFRSLKPADEFESQTEWNIAHDNRLGPFGSFLRRSSLDELPQLWNILRGDMSLVGPRPERPHFVDQFSGHVPRYMARHRVPAGLTGWAQVHGLRGDTSIEDRARFDNYYIENWSPWLDVKILLRTISQVVRGQGR